MKQVFIARQPIFDSNQQVFAYELLFRNGFENACTTADLDNAATKVIADSTMVFGLERLLAGKKSFINVTRSALLGEYLFLLPPDQTVVEILETIEPEPIVLEAIKALRSKGYTIALDDFVHHPRFEPLIELAHYIKVDFLATPLSRCEELAKMFIPRHITMLAEKVEDKNIVQQASEMGYTLFQGYYFSRPEIITTKEVPSYKLNTLQLIRELHQPSVNINQLADIIKRDVSMSYKLLKFINSAFFSWQVEIHSVRHALVLMGQEEMTRWATVVSMVSMGEDKPLELVLTALNRARFLELMAPYLDLISKSQDLFLMGMFSMLDALMDRSLVELLPELPISKVIKEALLGKVNEFSKALDFCRAYESGDWEDVQGYIEEFGLDPELVPEYYKEAVYWTQKSFEQLVNSR